MTNMKIAIATTGDKGLHDQVSPVLARTKTFTIVEIKDNKVGQVKVLKNPAASLSRGRGPVVIRLLEKEGVNVVIASEFGTGLSALLDQRRIQKFAVKPKTPVIDVVREFAFSFLKLVLANNNEKQRFETGE